MAIYSLGKKEEEAVKFSLIDRSKAPDPKSASANKNADVFNELVTSLVPGKVARVELTGKETPRGVKASITRAGKRMGKTVRSWDVDGKVYAELVEGTYTETVPEQMDHHDA